ncbi:MAG: cation transporter [Dehalococcoidia bacterium]|nr:cation transporter [Dehalococcoidia bacterium]MCB9490894.1 cation transporter [Dehalococcoidia bacterium]
MAHARANPEDHGHSHTSDRRRLAIALVLALGTAAMEVIGGVVSGSLALLADAGHVVTDATALTLALAAVWISNRPHTRRLTYGYHRVEVLTASLNGLLLFGIAALVGWHAVERLRTPSDVESGTLLVVAAFGLGSNVIALFMLHGSESVNVRAARLHVLSDLGGSVAAVAAGLIGVTTGWDRADPALSLVIVVLVCVGAWRLLNDTISILMQRTPPGLDLAEMQRALRTIPGVHAVHDVHVWTVTSGFVVFTAHIEVHRRDPFDVVHDAVHLLEDRYGIEHAAIHPERVRLLDIEDGGPREPASEDARAAESA